MKVAHVPHFKRVKAAEPTQAERLAQLRERGFYDCPELGKTCNRPGAYDAFSLPSLMGGKLVQPKGVGR